MDKSTNKKIRGQPISFPSVFTINELTSMNPDIVEITLRYRINTSIDRNIITQIGTIRMPVGRPHVVFAKLPISTETAKSLKDRKVIVYEDKAKKFKDIFEPTKEMVT